MITIHVEPERKAKRAVIVGSSAWEHPPTDPLPSGKACLMAICAS